MSGDGALLELAAASGIATRFHDAWGKQHDVPQETLRALLRALGADPANPARLAQAATPPPVEPVVVLAAERPETPIALTLPIDIAAPVEWELRLETGETRRGASRIAELTRIGELADGRSAQYRLALPAALPLGYHRLHLHAGTAEATSTIIVAPATCHVPEDDGRRRSWALTVQLYGLRSGRNWGIGDFTDLAFLGQAIGPRGADAVGLNPLHALFPAEPRHISPYSPSSRIFLNPLYLDVEAIPDFAECEPARRLVQDDRFRAQIAAARHSPLVDHAAVAGCKRPVLELLFESFRATNLGGGMTGAVSLRGEAIRKFQIAGAGAPPRFSLFEALQEHALAAGHGFSWRRWPEALRDPDSAETRRFAAGHEARLEFFQYLQWEADRQLGEAGRLGRAAGLGIGLYRDLAVGVDPSGGEAWSDQELLVPGASIGAPPDLLNLKGQNWGLAPFNPVTLRRRAYAPFVAAVRANMRHAGALRIDHVMALEHLYWIPEGADAAAGAYVDYSLHDLIRIVALESRRQRCTVVGEDLGTVPSGFRERMAEARILSYRVLMFERDHDGGFLPPQAYPALASASAATHDISTVKGFWLGHDLAVRERLDLYPSTARSEEDRAGRIHDRRRLLDALRREGLLAPELERRVLPADDAPTWDPALGEAVHRFLARSPATLVLVQIEDALGEIEQANLPGTVDQHPNWRRKIAVGLEGLVGADGFARLCAALAEERKRPEQTS